MNKRSKFLAFLIIVLALCCSKTANAQSPQKFSFGLNGGIANNKFDSYAIGGDMRFLFNISKRLAIPLTIGFTSIKEKGYVTRAGVKNKGDSNDFYVLKTGVKGFVSETGVGIYVLLEAGIVAPGMKGAAGIPIHIFPAVGYGFKNRMDLAVKYEDYGGHTGFTGLRLGYWF